MTKIDPSMYLSNQEQTNEPSPDLEKDDFLKILMTQLQNQDPTDPMDDSEFVSQMATFSSLEQMTNMSESMDILADNQPSPVAQYSQMIGQEVSYDSKKNDDEAEDEESTMETSLVTAVRQKDDETKLELENGERIDPDSIRMIGSPVQDEADNDEADKMDRADPVEGRV